MAFRDIIDKIGERSKNRKQMIRDLDEQVRIQKLVEDRQKSANERELERFMKESREEQIKFELDKARKLRDHDIKFGHNPLNVKNITNHTDWEVLKEKNLFGNNKNMFMNQPSVLHSNKKLLKSNMRLMR